MYFESHFELNPISRNKKNDVRSGKFSFPAFQRYPICYILMNFKGQYGVIYLVYMIRKCEGFRKVPPGVNRQNSRYLSNQLADFNFVNAIGKEILSPFQEPIS